LKSPFASSVTLALAFSVFISVYQWFQSVCPSVALSRIAERPPKPISSWNSAVGNCTIPADATDQNLKAYLEQSLRQTTDSEKRRDRKRLFKELVVKL
jgi:hypothetical protein